MTTWLVTGGAGYIGAHVVRALLASGRGAVVLDDLSTGERGKVPEGVPLVVGDVADRAAVTACLREHGVHGVVHLAAKKAVGESVAEPLRYYRENVGGLVTLLESCQDAGADSFVYSSSASVYGNPPTEQVDEDTVLRPESPYGETKVIGEWLLRDAGAANALSWVALRYFNVVGAGAPELGDTGVHNLVPLTFRALARGDRPQVYGDDYPTPDGTCIRDYVDVADLADAHVAAAARAEAGGAAEVYNVGRGEGVSVRQVMDVVSEVVGRDVGAEVVDRRPGDPAACYAAVGRIADELGWQASRDLRAMVASAFAAWQAGPTPVPPA